MAAFTAVANGFAPQSNMSEIVDAVNERRAAAISAGATSGIPAAIPQASGTAYHFSGDGTNKPHHLLIQEMLEALAVGSNSRYVDHGATSPEKTPMTLALWRTRASLNASGFRRATAFTGAVAPTFSYGKIQTGDIAGYWIWQDIVAGIKALQWTRASWAATAKQGRSGTGTDADRATAIAAADTDWAAASWGSEIFPFAARFCDIDETLSGSDYVIDIDGNRAKGLCTFGANAPVAGSAEYWYQAVANGANPYFDFELVAEDAWVHFDTTAFAAAAASVTSTLTTMEAAISNPAATADAGAIALTDNPKATTDNRWVVLKWTFSRT